MTYEIPDNFPLWEEIISYLPFHERIRIGRVNKRLRQESINVISKTKILRVDWIWSKEILNSSTKYRDRISGKQMSAWMLERAIIRHCASKLVRLELGDAWLGDDDYGQSITSVVGRYQLPKLEYLDLGDHKCAPITMRTILAKTPNLRTFIRQSQNTFKFPMTAEFVGEKLESITLEMVNEDTLQSMIGKLPNLRRLKLEKCQVRIKILDTFLANFPQLESLDIEFASHSMKDDDVTRNTCRHLHELNHLWRLTNLKELALRSVFRYSVREYLSVDLKRIIASFPNLIRLELDPFKPTKGDLIDLFRTCTQMEEIRLNADADDDDDEDCLDSETIQQIAIVGRMKKFKFPYSRIKSTNYATLVRSCPRLVELEFERMEDLSMMGQEIDKVLRPFEGSGGGRRLVRITFLIVPGVVDFEPPLAHGQLKEADAKKYMKELLENEGIKLRCYVPRIKRVNGDGEWIPDSDYSIATMRIDFVEVIDSVLTCGHHF